MTGGLSLTKPVRWPLRTSYTFSATPSTNATNGLPGGAAHMVIGGFTSISWFFKSLGQRTGGGCASTIGDHVTAGFTGSITGGLGVSSTFGLFASASATPS